ncbi:MAG TPA: glutathione S-transferase C-terminal domain-containing protein, partial [Woeseiaceae bacterium]|nr:glutathione S-transferase C-terminal domain-containing protein [Woeseiaceae bacterium]
IPLAREDFSHMAAVLDRHMEGRSYIVGDTVTAADCITAYVMDWANEVNLLGDFPRLQAYLERMYLRSTAPPRIAQAFAEIQGAAT